MTNSPLKSIEEISNDQLVEAVREICGLSKEYALLKHHISLLLLDLAYLINGEILARGVGDRELAARIHRELDNN